MTFKTLLTIYVRYLRRGMPINVAADGPATGALARGEASFFRKSGRLNFAHADADHEPVARAGVTSSTA
jgi:hypothetical protein